MKRRLFLHLGLSKTGTTSIQAFLCEHMDMLAERGVIYPDYDQNRPGHPAAASPIMKRDAGRKVNHQALALEIRQGGRNSAGETPRTRLWAAMFERIDTQTAHTVIISYENFYIRPDLYQFDMLADNLQSFDVHGIIYLRPQDDWLVSLYGQTIRGEGRAAHSFSQFIQTRGKYLKYSIMLDEIVAHMPLDSLIVADFERASASGLLSDFFERIGISRDIPGPPAEQHRVNQSLPPWALLFMLRCNQAGISDEAFVQVKRKLGNLRPGEMPRLRSGLDLATPEEREQLRAVAAADADRLKQRYGISIGQRIREPVAYRPFDQEDVDTIKDALAARVPRSALSVLSSL